MKLRDIADYVQERISSDNVTLENYITTDCLLQNKEGRTLATNLPPQRCTLISYEEGDVLVANIRPYLRKIWLADCKGGASADVLVFRAKKGHSSQYLYSVLLQDSFYDWVMKGPKGSRMPRGDKDRIMSFPIQNIGSNKDKVGKIIANINSKISLNKQINENLEALARQLYDYWFVQFDFPDENGKPYKSSGGAMKYDTRLKRDIPIDWHCGNLFEIAKFTNGLACQNNRPEPNGESLPVIKIKEMRDGFTNETELVKADIPENVKVYNGDVLFSWSASLEVMLWCYGNGGLNQHIFKVTPANNFPKSFYFFQLLNYVDVFKHIAEARKTTMGHITQDHLQQSMIAIPDDVEIANKLEKRIAPIFEAIINNQVEISNLVKQRDELLPLLMNGQVALHTNSHLLARLYIIYRVS